MEPVENQVKTLGYDCNHTGVISLYGLFAIFFRYWRRFTGSFILLFLVFCIAASFLFAPRIFQYQTVVTLPSVLHVDGTATPLLSKPEAVWLLNHNAPLASPGVNFQARLSAEKQLGKADNRLLLLVTSGKRQSEASLSFVHQLLKLLRQNSDQNVHSFSQLLKTDKHQLIEQRASLLKKANHFKQALRQLPPTNQGLLASNNLNVWLYHINQNIYQLQQQLATRSLQLLNISSMTSSPVHMSSKPSLLYHLKYLIALVLAFCLASLIIFMSDAFDVHIQRRKKTGQK